jgi:hypothetical protein
VQTEADYDRFRTKKACVGYIERFRRKHGNITEVANDDDKHPAEVHDGHHTSSEHGLQNIFSESPESIDTAETHTMLRSSSPSHIEALKTRGMLSQAQKNLIHNSQPRLKLVDRSRVKLDFDNPRGPPRCEPVRKQPELISTQGRSLKRGGSR